MAVVVLMSTGLMAATEPKVSALKSDLEEAMGQVRKAILKKDYEGFVRSVALLEPSAKLTKSKWLEAVENRLASRLLLNNTFPDLKKSTRFIDISKTGGWAVYYAEVRLDDPNYLSVGAVLFRQNKGRWLPVGLLYSFTKARPGSQAAMEGFVAWEGEDDIRTAIRTMPEFQLESLAEIPQ